MRHFNLTYQTRPEESRYPPLWSELPAAVTTYYATENAVPRLYTSGAPDPRISGLKGNVIEFLQGRALAEPTTKSLLSITPHRIGNAGIDGIFGVIEDGKVARLLVVESKFGKATLNPVTSDGKQMNSNWINTRLSKTCQKYEDFAEQLNEGELTNAPPQGCPDETISIPHPEGGEIRVARVGSKYFVDRSVTKEEAINAAEHLSNVLKLASDGDFPYDGFLFKGTPREGDFFFSLYETDSNGNHGNQALWTTTYSNSSSEFRNAVENSIEQNLRDSGFKEKHIGRLVEKILSEPEYLHHLQESPEASLLDGMIYSGLSGLLSGGINFIRSTLLQINRGGYITDLHRERAISSISMAIGTSLGVYVGIQSVEFLEISDAGEIIVRFSDNIIPTDVFAERLLGSFGAAAAAGITINLARYLLGYGDEKMLWRGLLRTGAKLTATGAATSATMAAVMTLATASTGTPISALSGAAAYNASLAFLGGGSVASGGGGMAVGGMVLSGIGIGVGVVVVVGLSLYIKHLDESEKKRYLDGQIHIAERISNSTMLK